MKPSFSRSLVVMAFPLAAGVLAVIAACSGGSSSNGGGGDDNNPGGSGTDGGGAKGTPGSCPNSTIAISFSPMYSAYVPGSNQHTFQIPAIADAQGVTWSASDPSVVSFSPDPTTGGTMITVQGTGDVDVVATAADGTCGTSKLTITSAEEADWQIGNARYNDGNSLRLCRPPRDGGTYDAGACDAGMSTPDAGPACTNCHGPTATSGPFKDVSHTPEQTGGFSDQDLVDIVVNGVVPDGGYFDPNVIIPDAGSDPTQTARAYRIWQSFHKWSDIGPDQQKGMVVYLRSLTPAPQEGSSNFGGRGPRDGGYPPRDGAATDQ